MASAAAGLRHSLVWFVGLAACGIALAVAFESDYLLPTKVSALAIFVVTLVGLFKLRLWAASPLGRLMVLLYFMPFSLSWGYLFDDDYTWWYTPLSIAYMSNPVIVDGMLMLGLIGLVALLAGLWLARLSTPQKLTVRLPRSDRALQPVGFAALLVIGVFFSYISTPDETIFSAIYSAASGVAGQVNFNASSMVAYMLLALLWIDTERESRLLIQRYKRWAVLGTTLFILVFFQILRGDRDSFGLVVALAGLYVTEPKRTSATTVTTWRPERYLLVGASGGAVLAAFLAVTTLRTRVADGESVPLMEAIVEGYKESTWGSVLLTNLSLAAQYHEGRMEQEWGLTYLDYLYSLPPGFVTYALNIKRPIEPDQGPNFWFTDVSSGGVHIVTVPFKNFHTPGVLLILCLIGFVIGRAEIAGRHPLWPNRLWYATFFVGSAQWFWYGDMPIIRAMMASAITAGLYFLATRTISTGLVPVGSQLTSYPRRSVSHAPSPPFCSDAAAAASEQNGGRASFGSVVVANQSSLHRDEPGGAAFSTGHA